MLSEIKGAIKTKKEHIRELIFDVGSALKYRIVLIGEYESKVLSGLFKEVIFGVWEKGDHGKNNPYFL
jgi:hypothetical protein